MKTGNKNILYYFVCVYFSGLFVWLAAWSISGDRFAYLSILNILAVYLFFPLPLVVLLNLFLRHWEIWVGIGLFGLVFVLLWGGLFIGAPSLESDSGTLRVMTYNLLGWNTSVAPQVEVIRRSDADVVFLQELNLEVADMLESELDQLYPYRVLDPIAGVTGMGVLSKYPLTEAGISLPLEWIGKPQVLDLDWNGNHLRLVNFHMAPTNFFIAAHVNQTNAMRQAQAQVLLDLHAVDPALPLIAAGDTNSAPLSQSYRVLAAEFGDAWQDSGFGLGHTFPGSDVPGSSRPVILGIPVPQWLIRIDYIFYTPQLRAVTARLAPFDGVSDHRGVIAELIADK